MNLIIKKIIILLLLASFVSAQENWNEALQETTKELSLEKEINEQQFVEVYPDFRGVSWGSSQEIVLRKELLQPVQKKIDRLVYQTDYLGFSAKLYYLFEQDKLVNGQIVFPSSFHYSQSRKEMFSQIKDHLEKRWGKPLIDESSSLKKDQFVLNKNFRFKVLWVTNNNFIILNFWSNNDKQYLNIVTSPNPNRKKHATEEPINEVKDSTTEVIKDIETPAPKTDVPILSNPSVTK